MSKLREKWNFRSDVAIKLEFIARGYFGHIENLCETKYSADAIEGGTFAEVMICLLEDKYKDNRQIEKTEFINKCREYLGKSAGEIDNEISDSLINEFEWVFE